MKVKVNWKQVNNSSVTKHSDNWFRILKKPNQWFIVSDEYSDSYAILFKGKKYTLFKKFFITEKDIYNIKFSDKIDKELK